MKERRSDSTLPEPATYFVHARLMAASVTLASATLRRRSVSCSQQRPSVCWPHKKRTVAKKHPPTTRQAVFASRVRPTMNAAIAFIVLASTLNPNAGVQGWADSCEPPATFDSGAWAAASPTELDLGSRADGGLVALQAQMWQTGLDLYQAFFNLLRGPISGVGHAAVTNASTCTVFGVYPGVYPVRGWGGVHMCPISSAVPGSSSSSFSNPLYLPPYCGGSGVDAEDDEEGPL